MTKESAKHMREMEFMTTMLTNEVRAEKASVMCYRSKDNTYETTTVSSKGKILLYSGAEKRDAVAKALVERIRKTDKGHIDTGIFGTRYIGDVLCDLGEVDLLIDMHSQKNYPGFGYMFEQGATTLWEQWAFRGIMHSHNHAMMSGAASWLYTHLAGLRPAKHGYREILVKPCFPKAVDSVSLERDTPYGTVAVGWRRIASGIKVTVTTPKNVSGTLCLPGRKDLKLPPGETPVVELRN